MIFSVSLNMKTKYSPYSMTTIWFYVVTTQNNTGLINIFNILLLSLSKQSATKSKLEIKGKGKKQTRNDTGKKKKAKTLRQIGEMKLGDTATEQSRTGRNTQER